MFSRILRFAPARATAPTTTLARHFAKKAAASLGIIRLDYDYPPALGDIDHPGSFGYDVYYRVVPKLTFEMCQSGKLDDEVKENFIDAVRYLEAKGVTGITGDCGFFFWFQALARQTTKLPIYMSSLCLLPAVTCAYAKDEKIAIFTANSESLTPMRDLIRDECGVDTQDQRYIIVGCQDVDGFEAVADGDKVDVEKVAPGVVQLAKDVVAEHPDLRAIVFECTELPPYTDHVRAATGLPVFDAISACNTFIGGSLDNKRYGLNDWQEDWDGEQDNYKYGDNLSDAEQEELVNKVHD